MQTPSRNKLSGTWTKLPGLAVIIHRVVQETLRQQNRVACRQRHRAECAATPELFDDRVGQVALAHVVHLGAPGVVMGWHDATRVYVDDDLARTVPQGAQGRVGVDVLDADGALWALCGCGDRGEVQHQVLHFKRLPLHHSGHEVVVEEVPRPCSVAKFQSKIESNSGGCTGPRPRLHISSYQGAAYRRNKR